MSHFLIGLVKFIVTGLISALSNGLAIYIMWGWFVEPLGLPAITWLQSAGLLITVEIVRHKIEKDPPQFDRTRYIINSFVIPALLVLLGFIITLMT